MEPRLHLVSGTEQPAPQRLDCVLVGRMPGALEVLRRSLGADTGRRVELRACADGREALRAVEDGGVDCVISAERLDDMSGVTLLGQLVSAAPAPALAKVLVSAQPTSPRGDAGLLSSYGIEVVEDACGPVEVAIAAAVRRSLEHASRSAQRIEGHLQAELRGQEGAHRHLQLEAGTTAMMHALRTPLTVVQESVSLVMDGLCGPLRDQQRKFLAQARGACTIIDHRLDELLEFVRSDATAAVPESTVNLAATVDALIDGSTVSDAALQLTLAQVGEVPRVSVNSQVLTSVLWRLIGPVGKELAPRSVFFLIMPRDGVDGAVSLEMTRQGPQCLGGDAGGHAAAMIDVHVARHLLATQRAHLHVKELTDSCAAFQIDFEPAPL